MRNGLYGTNCKFSSRRYLAGRNFYGAFRSGNTALYVFNRSVGKSDDHGIQNKNIKICACNDDDFGRTFHPSRS